MLFPTRRDYGTLAADLNQAFIAAAGRARTEEDFRIGAVEAIHRVAEQSHVLLDLRAEMAIARGRADAAFNRVIIEFERPGVMRLEPTAPGTAHAIDQLRNYLQDQAREGATQLSDLTGVALDGHFIAFVRHLRGDWQVDTYPQGVIPTERFLRQLLSLGSGRALTTKNLVEDFGADSPIAVQTIGALYRSFAEDVAGPELRDALFTEWVRLFGAISGVDAQGLERVAAGPLSHLANRAGLRRPEAAQFLFCVHTYFAMVVKLIAYSAVARQTVPLGLSLAEWAGLDNRTLAGRADDLERGGLFQNVGLRNFLEGDFFGWYVPAWTNSIADSVRAVATRLDDYDPGSIQARPELTRDLLKGLYQYLMPREIRHRLGEYYTPDWLAELLLDSTGFTGIRDQRLLDPACGSGTFLVLAANRVRAAAQREGLSDRDTLLRLLNSISGFDLNPLAVLAARATYVLAIVDLLPSRTTEVDIPVYLADSVHVPTAQGLVAGHTYLLETAVETFAMPSWLRDRVSLDQLAAVLEQSVRARVSEEVFKERLLAMAPEPPTPADVDAVASTFRRLAQLHQEKKDGVWARIIHNAFMPLFIGKFSHVVGNPPWVAWEHLDTRYRDKTAGLWDFYQLHPRPGQMGLPSRRTRSDMSILMTYACFDRYVSRVGTLGFLITASVFKSEAAGRGFRRFQLPGGDDNQIEPVDVADFTDFQPFEAASNRTAAVVLRRNAFAYPVNYRKWRRGLLPVRPDSDLSVTTFRAKARVEDWIAAPVRARDLTSPWLTGPPDVVTALHRVVGRSPYRDAAREGVNTRGANAIYWVRRVGQTPNGTPIVENLTEHGRGARLPRRVQGVVEKALLHPLVRGADVQRWRATPRQYIVLPYTAERPGEPLDPDQLARRYPHAHAYLMGFEEMLRARRRFRNFDPAHLTAWELYNVGAYTFAPYKVVWREQSSSFTTAIVGPQDGAIPVTNHKLMSVGIGTLAEAAFVAALLNSTPVRVLVDSYALELSLSSAILDYVNVPLYRANEPTHAEISRLGVLMLEANQPGVATRIEDQIDEAAATCWGIGVDALRVLKQFDLGLARVAEPQAVAKDDNEDA